MSELPDLRLESRCRRTVVDDDGPVLRDEGYLLDNQQAEAGRRFILSANS